MEKERNDKNLPGQIEDSSYPDDWWLDEEDSADGLPVFDPDKAQNYAKPGEPMITGYEALERRRGIRRPERKLSRREKRAWKKAQKYEEFAKECYRILKDNTHAYFFTRFDCYPHHYECLKKAGFTMKNCMVVEKGTVGGIGDLKGSFANNAEWIIFCQKGRRVFNHTKLLKNKKKAGVFYHRGRNEPSQKYKTRFNACWFGSDYPKATYNSAWQKRNGIYHPTIKNVECLSWLIQISSLPGELVFDGYMGTGSTALAARQNGRNYLGAEIAPEHFKTIQKRLSEQEV